jgi:hypothetical protein
VILKVILKYVYILACFGGSHHHHLQGEFTFVDAQQAKTINLNGNTKVNFPDDGSGGCHRNILEYNEIL